MKSEHKTNKLIFIIVAVAILMSVILIAFRIYQWSQYDEVSAEVVELETVKTDHSGQPKAIPLHFVVYRYSYGGKDYESRQQIFTEFGLEKNDVRRIRIDPADPDTLFNSYQTKCMVAILFFLVLFDSLLLIIIKRDSSKKGRQYVLMNRF